MQAYYNKGSDKKYHLMLLLDGKVCDGGKYNTRKDCINYAKRELGITDVSKWEGTLDA